jgi:hypothetical protein
MIHTGAVFRVPRPSIAPPQLPAAYSHLYRYVCMCVCVYVCMYVCMYVCVYRVYRVLNPLYGVCVY